MKILSAVITFVLLGIKAQSLVAEEAAMVPAFDDGQLLHQVRVPVNGGIGICAGDFDGDGDEDIMVATSRSLETVILSNDGAGHFLEKYEGPRIRAFTASGGVGTAVADIDGDGLDDILTSENRSGYVEWMRSNGEGGFRRKTAGSLRGYNRYGGVALAAADFNGDGKTDFVGAVSSLTKIYFFQNLKGRSFTRGRPVGEQKFSSVYGTSALVADDFDADGKPDFASVTSVDGDIDLFTNRTQPNHSPRFVQSTAGRHHDKGYYAKEAGVALASGHFGSATSRYPDLLVLSSHTGVVQLFRNNSGKTFEAGPSLIQLPQLVRESSVALATGDFNRDGLTDIALGETTTGKVWVYLARN